MGLAESLFSLIPFAGPILGATVGRKLDNGGFNNNSSNGNGTALDNFKGRKTTTTVTNFGPGNPGTSVSYIS